MVQVDPKRSWTMSRVKSKHTSPEMHVRKKLRSLGHHYRLHGDDLPGRPDIVFRGRRKAIFVHGCFWHRHDDVNCKLTRTPKSNLEFWNKKFEANVLRDERNRQELRSLGWDVLVLWECQLPDDQWLTHELFKFLGDHRSP